MFSSTMKSADIVSGSVRLKILDGGDQGSGIFRFKRNAHSLKYPLYFFVKIGMMQKLLQ